LEQSIWQGACCAEASFRNSNLTYADFSHAELGGADFSGARMFRTRLHRVSDRGAKYPLLRAGALGDDEALAEAEGWWDEHNQARKGSDDAQRGT
jgi:hypothetical protein